MDMELICNDKLGREKHELWGGGTGRCSYIYYLGLYQATVLEGFYLISFVKRKRA